MAAVAIPTLPPPGAELFGAGHSSGSESEKRHARRPSGRRVEKRGLGFWGFRGFGGMLDYTSRVYALSAGTKA